MKFKNSLGWKFSLVQIVTITLFAISAIIVSRGLEDVKSTLQQQYQMNTTVLEISELVSLFKSKEILVNELINSKDEKNIQQFQSLSKQFEAGLQEIEAALQTDKQRQLLLQISEKDAEINSLFVKKVEPANIVQDQLRSTKTIQEEMITLLNKLLEMEKENYSHSVTQTNSLIKGNSLILIIAIIVSSIVGLTLVLLVSRNIQRSLNRVVQVANHIANKDLLVKDIDYIEEDEIGQLSISINRMKSVLREMMEQITTTANIVTKESRKLTQYSDFIISGSRGISETMQELESGAEEQSNSSNELVHSMQNFSEKILSVINQKEQSNLHSKKMLSMTGDGSSYMESSIVKMNSIDKSIEQSLSVVKGLDKKATQITTLVQVIKEIANQTNLLALNAGIEAARAGEHGRGFTIVANEVRKLSDLVQSSITDITAIVNEIQSESKNAVVSLESGYKIVTDGKALMTTTSETFNHLKGEINEMGIKIENMSYSLDDVMEQTEIIHQFLENTTSIAAETSAGVSQVSATVQQFNGSMEEVVESVTFLDQETIKLHALLNEFKA